MKVDFRPLHAADLDAYFAFSKQVQQRLIAKGLKQWIPTAHKPYKTGVRTAYQSYSSLFVNNILVACFKFIAFDADRTMQVSNIVVRPSEQGNGYGALILAYCERQTVAQGRGFLRLSAESSNRWLTAYYEARGFIKYDEIESYPAYFETLYEKHIIEPVSG